jgi:hypothetical protein
MIESLTELATSLPRTLVLVFDQGEEVLSLRQDEEAEKSRNEFFNFLAGFSRSKISVKLMVALRSEWFGKFYNQIRKRPWDFVNIRDYYLGELNKGQIAIAIKHPSKLGAYGFAFAEGLAEGIAEDLMINPQQGGVLPVMQIVCSRLYKEKKRETDNGHFVITEDDYRELGGIQGQLDRYLRDVLAQLCASHRIPPLFVPLEIENWGKVLNVLVKSQVDGTVTTDRKTREELTEAARAARCQIDFDAAMKFLSDDDQRIVQRSEVFNPATRQSIVAYSLGHDAIGLALKTFMRDVEARLNVISRIRKSSRRAGIACVIVGALAFGTSLAYFGESSFPSWLRYLLIFFTGGLTCYGIAFIGFSFLSLETHRRVFKSLSRHSLLRQRVSRTSLEGKGGVED